MKKEPFSFGARLRSFRYAFRGIYILIREEHNARIHLAVMICVVGAAAYLGFSAMEWVVLTVTISMVISAEAFNSAIEGACDHSCKGEHDPIIGRAKDLAAAGVLIVAMAAVVIGSVLFIPKIF